MSTSANPAVQPDQRDRIDRVIERMDDALRPQDVVLRQRELHGGIKFGSDFFGWLAATGMVVLLAAVAGAVGLVLISVGTISTGTITSADAQNSGPMLLAAAITLVVVVLLGYLSGGYVAGRMARFDGGRQGFGVWLWAVVITLALAVAGLITGIRLGLLTRLSDLPRPGIDSSIVLVGSIATGAAVLVFSLVGAVLGGHAGMRFHRRVDRAQLDREASDLGSSDPEPRDQQTPGEPRPDRKPLAQVSR